MSRADHATKKHSRRKLTQERADRINRTRDAREGAPSWEHDRLRVVLVDKMATEVRP